MGLCWNLKTTSRLVSNRHVVSCKLHQLLIQGLFGLGFHPDLADDLVGRPAWPLVWFGLHCILRCVRTCLWVVICHEMLLGHIARKGLVEIGKRR